MGVLEGKTIAIVGGTSGLGLSGARACVGAGALVVVMGKDMESVECAQKELGDSAVVRLGDACLENEVETLLDAAKGRIDGLYHVAGGSGRKEGDGPLHELTDAGWDYTLRLNLTSLMVSNRAAVRRFLRQKSGGTILNMASVLGFSPSPKYFATHAYAAAKAAIVGFSKSIAAYYAPQNIRVNVVAPGLVETPMSQRVAGDAKILSFIHTKQPLDGGRIGHADDLDAAVVYFLGEGSRFVTGQVLAVSGGWEVSEGRE